MSPDPHVYEQRVRLHNKTSRDLDLVVEPWGEGYPFLQGMEYEVVGRALEPEPMQVIWYDAAVEVWSMYKAQIHLFRDGVEITPPTRGL